MSIKAMKWMREADKHSAICEPSTCGHNLNKCYAFPIDMRQNIYVMPIYIPRYWACRAPVNMYLVVARAVYLA